MYHLFILSIVFCSCQERKATLCSPSGEECVTIEDSYNTRLIYFDSNFGNNFIELDITNIDLETEGVFICWKATSGKIEVVNPKALVVNQQFDEDLYSFSNAINEEVAGKPNVKYFHQQNCFEFNIMTNSVFPKGHAILKN